MPAYHIVIEVHRRVLAEDDADANSKAQALIAEIQGQHGVFAYVESVEATR